ncbi:hypothetical protein NQZ68_028020 [Dissostichus eleginoides]|nr:hypothetical protein NQZ68_028020 [Dissostichus eleginoides]
MSSVKPHREAKSRLVSKGPLKILPVGHQKTLYHIRRAAMKQLNSTARLCLDSTLLPAILTHPWDEAERSTSNWAANKSLTVCPEDERTIWPAPPSRAEPGVNAEEEAGIGRGGIAVGGRYTNAAAKTLQSLSCSHIYTTTNTTNTNTQAGAGTTALSLISSSASMRVHAHQATEEQRKNLDLILSHLASESLLLSLILTPDRGNERKRKQLSSIEMDRITRQDECTYSCPLWEEGCEFSF